MNYLQVDHLTKSFGDLVLFSDINFSIDKDQKAAIIARNGAGKSSLLNILAKQDSPDSGNVIFRNDITVGYLEQIPVLNENLTVIENVFESSNQIVGVIKEYEQACSDTDSSRLNLATQAMDLYKAWDFEAKIKQILAQLKIIDFDQKVGELSGGQRKRVALANVLINEPDILILDEPTNHLDLEMIEWLESYLKTSKSTLLMVTHDRYFLDRVCDVILELDDNQMFRYKGNYSYYLAKREERIYNKSMEIEKAKSLFKKEQDWMNRMPQARATKAKYRIDSFYETKELASQKINTDQVQIDLQGARLGKKIIEIHHLSKRFDHVVIVDDFSYNFKRFEKIGIVGENGSGKTTFLNMLTQTEPYDKGTIETGSTVVFGYYTQEGQQFDENKKVIDVVKEIAEEIEVGDGRRLSPLQFLNFFLFTGDMQYSYVNKLSGGEKRRLYLLTVLMRNPNFLILDEPTNDLDILTLNVLEDYLKQFQGCVLIVSHDRFFMDKLVDHLFVFDGDGKVKDFPGNYTQYREWADKQKFDKKKEDKPDKIKKEKVRTKLKVKLTFKERIEFEELTKEIDLLEIEKSTIEDHLNNGKYEANEIVEATIRLSSIIKTIEEKSDRWLELSELA